MKMLPEDGYDARNVERIASILSVSSVQQVPPQSRGSSRNTVDVGGWPCFWLLYAEPIVQEIGYTQESTVSRVEGLEYLSMETSVDGDGL